MSEDLHSIDDIFRKDIEGHREELPPAAWEGISNHLDQQQAIYYRQKYRRLRRVTLGLLGLCFLAVIYVVFNQAGNKPASKNVQQPLSPVVAVQPNSSTAADSFDNTLPANTTEAGQSKDSSTADDTNNKNLPSTIILSERKPAGNPVGTANKPNTGKQESVIPATNTKSSTSVVQNTPAIERFIAVQPEKSAAENISADSNADKDAVAPNRKKQAVTHLKMQPVRRQFPAPAFVAGDSETEITQQGSLHTNQQETTKKLQAAEVPLNLPANVYLPQLLSSSVYRSGVKTLPELSATTISLRAATVAAGNHKRKSIHQFSLSAFATPNFNFSRLEDDRRFARPGRNREDAHREEQRDISFSTGLLLSYQLSPALAVQSGIGVSIFSTTINPKTIYAAPDNGGRIRYELPFSYGNAYLSPKDNVQLAAGDSATTSLTNSRLTYVNIPLALSYAFNKGRTTFYPSIGAGFNILTSSNATTSLSAVAGKEDLSAAVDGLRPTYLNGQIGFGVEYGISRKFSIGLQPNINFALTPINRQTPVKAYQNFFSLQAAVRFKL